VHVLPTAGEVSVGQIPPMNVKQLPSTRQQAVWHGLGVQVLPGAGVVPAGHALPVKMKQAFTSQQAITHGLGVQIAPGKKLTVGQLACVVVIQPAAVQHAPRHGFGLQVVTPVNRVPLQSAGVGTNVHEPSGLQQTNGQGFGWQVVVPGSNVPTGQGPVVRKQKFRSQQA